MFEKVKNVGQKRIERIMYLKLLEKVKTGRLEIKENNVWITGWPELSIKD